MKVDMPLNKETKQTVLIKKLKFDHTTKWYVHKLESVQENEMHKTFSDFEMKIIDSILTKRLDLVLIKKKRTFQLTHFAISVDHKKNFF